MRREPLGRPCEFPHSGLLTFLKIDYDEGCLIHRFILRSVRDSEGQAFSILEEAMSLPHLFFAVAAYIDRHAFRARAKEVCYVDTMRLSERTRAARQRLAGRNCRACAPHARGRSSCRNRSKQCMSEDAILDLLGKQSPLRQGLPPRSRGCSWPPRIRGSTASLSRKRRCNRCSREVSAGTHICPYCHTYIANLSDF